MQQAAEATRTQRLYNLSYDSLILHCPGPMRVEENPFRSQWIDACETYFGDQEIKGNAISDERLTIVTYNNHEAECLLEAVAKHRGLDPLVVLGKHVTSWQWIEKIRLVYDYLASGACRTEYLLCLDGDDILIVGQPKEIVDRYRELDCRILFCNTRGDQPPSPECWDFENSVPRYTDPLHRHLNAGGYIGETAYIQECLAEILAAYERRKPWCFSEWGFDDQLAWRQLHRREYPRIQVDAGCRVFLRFDEDR
jgi:hypothetical protein